MRALKRTAKTSPFVPDFMAHSLLDVDFQVLRDRGVKFVAFDADSTLVKFWGRHIDPKTKRYLMEQRQLFKGWCIASNRLTNDLIPLGQSIDAPVIRADLIVRKPHRRFFAQVIRHFNCRPDEIAMIGDKLVADVWGGKRSGLVTVWVERLGHDSPWDWLLRTRFFEQRILRRYLKE